MKQATSKRKESSIMRWIFVLMVVAMSGVWYSRYSWHWEEREPRRFGVPPPVIRRPSPLCPNPVFIYRHYCLDCETYGDALSFTNERREDNAGYQVRYNHVFFGSEETLQVGFSHHWKEDVVGGVCRNIYPISALRCDRDTQTCSYVGRNCVVEHHTESGHMGDVECEE